MKSATPDWLSLKYHLGGFVPKIQETRVLFRHRPYYFPDFVARALTFLQSDEARSMGFEYDPKHLLPCKWKCSDESVFQVDLTLHAYTGLNPFDKGRIGGFYNEGALSAAVHHGPINIDFGGSHVGYIPGPAGGYFGRIWRPQQKACSTDCGHLLSVITPFTELYRDACENILIYSPTGDKVIASIPNEYLQPIWSSHRIKLLLNLEALTAGEVEYLDEYSYTHTSIARSLFNVSTQFLDSLDQESLRQYWTNEPTPIGVNLAPRFFDIYDSEAELDEQGLPQSRLLLYMKYIVASQYSPPALKAAIVNTNIEHNRLSDAVRSPQYAPYSFASFTGIFIDMYNEKYNNYINLFQPIAITIKPRGRTRQIELLPEDITEIFDRQKPAQPVFKLPGLAQPDPEKILDLFTYEPGEYSEKEPVRPF